MRPGLIIILALTAFTSIAQQKRALIIAIGDYPKECGCPPIASITDIKYLKNALRHHEFEDNRIDTLKNQKATKKEILKALDRLASTSKEKDIVLVHISAHGQQIQDQPTIEEGKDEVDGFDEAILAYDAKGRYRAGDYEGENHVRDDELGEKFTAIRKAIGNQGNLLVLIDACHSGTATRSDQITVSRGEPDPFINPNITVDPFIRFTSNEKSLMDNESNDAANMVVFSGSGPHQKNKQVKVGDEQVGSLTYAFYRALMNLSDEETYEDLFYRIKAFIQSSHPDQQPLAEGNLNQKVFAGDFKPARSRIMITQGVRDEYLRGDTVFTINKGLIDNVVPGLRLSVYPIHSREMYAEARIVKSGNFTSIAVSDKPLQRGEAYEAKLDEMSYGAFGLALKLVSPAKGNSAVLAKQLRSEFSKYSYLSFAEEADLLLDISDAGELTIITKADMSLASWRTDGNGKFSETQLDDLMRVIRNHARAKYLLSMSDGGDIARKIEVRLIAEDSSRNLPSGVELKPGDAYRLVISNNNPYTVFFTIIDLIGDTAHVMFPGRSVPEEYLTVSKGKKLTIPFRVSRKAREGLEILKIIFSREQIELTNIFEQRTTRANLISFERAVKELFNDQAVTTRSISNVSAEEIGVATISFSVKN